MFCHHQVRLRPAVRSAQLPEGEAGAGADAGTDADADVTTIDVAAAAVVASRLGDRASHAAPEHRRVWDNRVPGWAAPDQSPGEQEGSSLPASPLLPSCLRAERVLSDGKIPTLTPRIPCPHGFTARVRGTIPSSTPLHPNFAPPHISSPVFDRVCICLMYARNVNERRHNKGAWMRTP